MNDEGTEAEYLESQSDGGAEDSMREYEREEFYKRLNKMKERYENAKNAETGATIECANCKRLILKKTYHQKFCKDSKCKDTYWNIVDEKRRIRAHCFKPNNY